jgi:hypothetical protein
LTNPECLLGFCIDLKTTAGFLTTLGVVTASGGTEVHKLSFVNALAIELPAGNTINTPYVLEVVDDLLTLVDSICPTTALPPTESYPWGQQQIEVPAVHLPPPTGPGG